jgi:hypothetical protein
MSRALTPRRSAARFVRVLSALAVLVGVIGMHAVGGMSMAAPTATGSPHTSMAMASLLDNRGRVAPSPVVAEPQPAMCVQDHCLATLRVASQLPEPAQFAAVTEPRAARAALAVQPHDVMLRAPPHAVCLTVVCVSRT